MKKFVALLLALVLVFSMSVPSFAYETELEALEDIQYYIYWIFEDFTVDLTDMQTSLTSIQNNVFNALSNLLDINEYTRLTVDELQKLNSNLFGETVRLTSFADSIQILLGNINDSVNRIETLFVDEEKTKIR